MGDALGFFIILVVFVAIVYITSKMDQKLNKQYKQEEIEENFCPPHKWSWEKQQDSNIEYIRCKRCRRLPGQLYEGN